MFSFDPERVHDFIFHAGSLTQEWSLFTYFLQKFCRVNDERLNSEVFSLRFANPIGLAAGFDKNGELANFFYSFGFGFEEIGTVSSRSAKGNSKPRIFRIIEEKAIVNSMGLPNQGADAISLNLQSRRFYPIGVNIAQTPEESYGDLGNNIQDIEYCFCKLAPLADYIVINISCPNVKDGCLFENPKNLDALLKQLKIKNNRVPLLLKLSADISDQNLEDIVLVGLNNCVDGYVISNARRVFYRNAYRGLSGKPLRAGSTEQIKMVYKMTRGKTPIIGVGGVDSAESAYEKIKSGASLIQLYTGLIYEGSALARRINKGLVQLLENDGYSSIAEAIGKDV